MTKAQPPSAKAAPLLVSRDFAAPLERVFAAWTTTEAIKRWFSPETLNVPEAIVDFRPGGDFVVCMRTPDGHDYWSRGEFDEIETNRSLSFTMRVAHGAETAFTVRTKVTFEAISGGARMNVRQEYEVHDPRALANISGASAGWRTTLDKLALLVAPAARSVVHGAFTLERAFASPPEAVFRAFADADAKAKWFVGGEGYTVLERRQDVRPGGVERVRGRWANGTVSTFDAIYLEVLPAKRILYVYEMHLNERKISVSLATLDIRAEGAGSRLALTEQGAFLDGYDDAGSREAGTRMLLDKLAAFLNS